MRMKYSVYVEEECLKQTKRETLLLLAIAVAAAFSGKVSREEDVALPGKTRKETSQDAATAADNF